MAVCIDEIKDEKEASLEVVLLLRHHYDVEAQCTQAAYLIF